MKITLGSLSLDGIRRTVASALSRVPGSCYVKGASSSGYVAGDPIYISHTLGEVPVMFSVMTKGNFVVYINDGDEKSWTNNKILVRCSAASKKFVLKIDGSL